MQADSFTLCVRYVMLLSAIILTFQFLGAMTQTFPTIFLHGPRLWPRHLIRMVLWGSLHLFDVL